MGSWGGDSSESDNPPARAFKKWRSGVKLFELSYIGPCIGSGFFVITPKCKDDADSNVYRCLCIKFYFMVFSLMFNYPLWIDNEESR